jgi:DNA mismatch endonuclease Vsr
MFTWTILGTAVRAQPGLMYDSSTSLKISMDTLSPRDRSVRMSLVRGADTKPEMKVRSIVHRLGFRYRLHVSKLPGKPDLVFPKLHKILFVHGCFRHRHLAIVPLGWKRQGLSQTSRRAQSLTA